MYKNNTQKKPRENEKSILESKYIEPNRPYSQNELKDMIDLLYKKYHLSNLRAEHKRCNHIYNVIENGKKETDIKNKKVNYVGNCSVCWKLSKTPLFLQNNAYNLVSEYTEIFYERPTKFNHLMIDLENSYYKWLYNEFN